MILEGARGIYHGQEGCFRHGRGLNKNACRDRFMDPSIAACLWSRSVIMAIVDLISLWWLDFKLTIDGILFSKTADADRLKALASRHAFIIFSWAGLFA